MFVRQYFEDITVDIAIIIFLVQGLFVTCVYSPVSFLFFCTLMAMVLGLLLCMIRD